jgi:hypothetical protein
MTATATENKVIKRLVLVTQLQEARDYLALLNRPHNNENDDDRRNAANVATLLKRLERTLDRLRRGWPVSKERL